MHVYSRAQQHHESVLHQLKCKKKYEYNVSLLVDGVLQCQSGSGNVFHSITVIRAHVFVHDFLIF